MTDEEFEYLHDQGKVPDWWYYQKSKKPVWMKWQEQTDKFNQELEERQNQKQQDKDMQAQLEKEVEKQLENAVEKALEHVFKGFLQS